MDMNMLKILPLEKTDAACIVKWNDDKAADFLLQWAGIDYKYPLSEKQIIDRIGAEPSSGYRMYKIVLDDDMIGTIELMNVDAEAKTAKIGKYLLNSQLSGNGCGTKALEKFISIIFSEFHLKKIWLSVFDFNKSAIRCYEKVGFKAVNQEVRPYGWTAINMEIENTSV